MIKKVVKKYTLGTEPSDLKYWLSRSPEERVAAVEYLREQFHGNIPRLQRTVRIIQQKQS